MAEVKPDWIMRGMIIAACWTLLIFNVLIIDAVTETRWVLALAPGLLALDLAVFFQAKKDWR